jgi:hypothetical protein
LFRVLLALCLLAGAARAQPIVVELFTSQGCSSCPPADALLGELARRPDVIALAFHVDYWDGLGWRDRFGLPLAARRQQRYTESLRLPSSFTPQAIIDGRASAVGSDRATISRHLVATPAGPPLILTADAQGLRVQLPAAADQAPCDVLLVSYLAQAATAIPRGENAGHTLSEYHIVRSAERIGGWDGVAATLRIARSALPADATHAVVLLQRRGQGAIVGAAESRMTGH